MMTLKEILLKAKNEKWALPHFNISDAVTLRGICEAAEELKSPLLIGTSEGEQKFIETKRAVTMISLFREEYGLPIFLNADHHRSVESAKEAIDAGYDSVHIDLSKVPISENLAGTKEIVNYANASGRDISVEGEVGYLVTESSKIYKEVVEVPEESLTKPAEAEAFVIETRVDRLAPAVGSLHGIAANAPKIDVPRIKAIREAVGEVTLVLHGGSGVTDEDVRAAIEAGINNVHVNTEIRVAYSGALRKFLKDNPDESTPYKIFAPVIEAVKRKAAEKIKLFGSAEKF
jgi:fructose-bisphosphate aldolase, class II